MDVTQPFIPTAGVVGILSMVTYFFLVVTMFVFLGNFIFSMATLPAIRSEYRITHILTIVVAALSGLLYYLIQSYYRNMLAELAAVTISDDQQTLIRESYNAIGQYRYLDWFITSPLLLIQLSTLLDPTLTVIRKSLVGLLAAAMGLFFFSYIGHQQLSFDNEIDTSLKAVWGIPAAIAYGFIFTTISRLGKQSGEQTSPANQQVYHSLRLVISLCWGLYLVGYFLTLVPVNFNWIHLLLTLADLVTKLSFGVMVYLLSTKQVQS